MANSHRGRDKKPVDNNLDSMLDTLQKMSGTTHRVFRNSINVTRDVEKIMFQNEGKATIGLTVQEMPTISYNDMAFIAERNSIVFRAGDSPIWNRNETILPMSWRLFANTIIHPGKTYTLQTIPTLSSALEFDVRKNMPDFVKMWEKRKKQASVASTVRDIYQKAYGYSDYEIEQLDQDNYSDDIMQLVNDFIIQQVNGGPVADEDMDEAELFDEYDLSMDMAFSEGLEYEDNDEQEEATAQAAAARQVREEKKFAGQTLSPSDLVDGNGRPNRQWEQAFIRVYREIRGAFENDTDNFFIRDGGLYDARSKGCFIKKLDERSARERMAKAAEDAESRVFAEDGSIPEEIVTYEVQPAFYQWLAKQDDWRGICGGRFEEAMFREMNGE